MAIGGILLAWLVYEARTVSAEGLRRRFGPLHTLLENKYYADVLYERLIVGSFFYELVAAAAAWFDRVVVDGAVNGAGASMRAASGVLRYAQSGQFQMYGAIGVAGLALMAILTLALS
jgi:NADH-quinone oxidoreductase subunit L